MYTAKKREKNYKKEKPRYIDLFFVTPPRQHHKSSFSISDAFKKGTEHKRRRRSIKFLRFSP
jgi:hypothetical protein